MNRDLVFGGATLAVAVIYYALSSTIPASDLADPIGPQGLPKIYAYVLGALSAILLVNSLRARLDAEESRLAVKRAAGILVIGVLYVVLVPWVGYAATIALLIAGTTYYQGAAITGRVVFAALSGAIFLWLLFVVLLGIPQPAGVWPW
jgi:hypothetical protein